MKKKILVLLGHPRVKSYCGTLADAYSRGAKRGGAHVHYVKLADLDFDAVGAHDFRGAPPLEKDLVKIQQMIHWAEHIVVVYPTWWGTAPALLKGFFDRIFTPGFAFKYRADGLGWNKLLKGRSARIITTTGGPWILNHLVYRAAGIKALKWATFWFAGISPVYVSEFNGVNMKGMSEERKQHWVHQIEHAGTKDAHRGM